MIELKVLELLLPDSFKREFLRDCFGMDEAAVKQRIANALEVYQVVTFGMEEDKMALLRRLHDITVEETGSGIQVANTVDGKSVTYAWHKVRAKMGERVETSTGTHIVDFTDPMNVVNAPKAAETNAKNRVTLSLVGYGFKGLKEILDTTPATPAAEPARPDSPAVNNAPASPAEDVRYEHKNYPEGANVSRYELDPRTVLNVLSGLDPAKVTELVKEDPAVERIQTLRIPTAAPNEIIPAFPKVTEEQVAALHKESDKLNQPSRDPANDSKPKAVEAPAEQQSIFGSAEAEPIDPNANASAILGSTKVVEETKSPVPSMTAGIFADLAASTGPTSASPVTDASLPSEQSLGTGPGQTDVADIPAEKPFSSKPTQIQFREFNKRCMGITRDGLKGIKDGGPALLAYMKKSLGTTQLETADVLLWEATLQELEAFKEPQKLFQHLKSVK